MSNKPERHVSRGPEPQDQTLSCRYCRTDSHLFISSIMPLWPDSQGAVQVCYRCTACGLSYRRVAQVKEFAGVLKRHPGSSDLVFYAGHYVHCGQSMQQTATGIVQFDGHGDSDEESREAVSLRLEIRMLECPCGFQLVLPD
jgi:hypothetical protein